MASILNHSSKPSVILHILSACTAQTCSNRSSPIGVSSIVLVVEVLHKRPFGSLVSFDKGARSVCGGVAVLSALGECAELLRNFGISFEKYLLKQVWHLFSTYLPNLRFACTLSSLALLKPAATVRVQPSESFGNLCQESGQERCSKTKFSSQVSAKREFLYLCAPKSTKTLRPHKTTHKLTPIHFGFVDLRPLSSQYFYELGRPNVDVIIVQNN